jgi:hypothetical protein
MNLPHKYTKNVYANSHTVTGYWHLIQHSLKRIRNGSGAKWR